MYRQDEPELSLEKILERLRSFGKGFRLGGFGGGGGNMVALFIVGLFVVALVIWLSTGFFTVQPGEEAALRRLGKFDNIQGPGLHWFWPAPIGTRDVVKVDEVRRLELGVRGATSVPEEALMITGDENLVDTQLLVQYDIEDLELFLFKVVDPAGITIKDVAETALRQVVGKRDIDDVLTVQKEAVQFDTREVLQRLLDTYRTGLNVREVKLLNVRPPEQVKDSFDDVVRAKEDKERIINLADAYKEGQLPVARGDAARFLENAEGFRQERIALATGQAQGFIAILGEYRQAKDVTRQRLYLEAMEEILPGITKLILENQSAVVVIAAEGTSSILPLPSSPEGGQ